MHEKAAVPFHTGKEMIDRLWKFTALVIDPETKSSQVVSRLYRRESCKELEIDVEGMQLKKFATTTIDDLDGAEEAYCIRIEKKDADVLLDQYLLINNTEGYDFSPEIEFLTAAFKNSGTEDVILIICLVFNDED